MGKKDQQSTGETSTNRDSGRDHMLRKSGESTPLLHDRYALGYDSSRGEVSFSHYQDDDNDDDKKDKKDANPAHSGQSIQVSVNDIPIRPPFGKQNWSDFLPGSSKQQDASAPTASAADQIKTIERLPTLIDGMPLSAEAFYRMIGMKAPSEAHKLTPSGIEAGSGIYHDIRSNYRRLARLYFLFETIIYAALVMQTLLATAFIVLGNIPGDWHIVIAGLGALSATLAVVLALAKGQGLSNRLRMERDHTWEVQIEAEELYWQVSGGRKASFEDVERVWRRFIEIKRNAAKNHPDTWTAGAVQVA